MLPVRPCPDNTAAIPAVRQHTCNAIPSRSNPTAREKIHMRRRSAHSFGLLLLHREMTLGTKLPAPHCSKTILLTAYLLTGDAARGRPPCPKLPAPKILPLQQLHGQQPEH
eukprot:1157322-Pelagomonas_calceolata.AAC.9